MTLAITRLDVANYLSVLIWIYTMLILVRILLSWVMMVWSLPEHAALRALVGFVEDVTEPYLQFWRRLIPPIKGGAGVIDVSPIIAMFALWLVGTVAVRLIAG
jgi:YggT family protein